MTEGKQLWGRRARLEDYTLTLATVNYVHLPETDSSFTPVPPWGASLFLLGEKNQVRPRPFTFEMLSTKNENELFRYTAVANFQPGFYGLTAYDWRPLAAGCGWCEASSFNQPTCWQCRDRSDSFGREHPPRPPALGESLEELLGGTHDLLQAVVQSAFLASAIEETLNLGPLELSAGNVLRGAYGTDEPLKTRWGTLRGERWLPKPERLAAELRACPVCGRRSR